MTDIVDNLLQGDRRAAARAISLVENNDPEKQALLSSIHPHTGNAYIIGLTGTPGSGKSTLADRLIEFYRQGGQQVGVIAVDPTSPFTGGAILGDRIRMQEHALDKGVFIRSMGTRGSLGGLSRATREAAAILDAMGMDIILVETVGVGQSEVDIVKTADTTLVVLTPAGGDSVQTLKAGIMEIADIFVVNKADIEGADRTIREVNMMLDLNQASAVWRPPVLPTRALANEGLEDLYKEIRSHRRHLEEGGRLQESRKEKARLEVMELVEFKIKSRVWNQIRKRDFFETMLNQILKKELDPYSAADQILKELKT